MLNLQLSEALRSTFIQSEKKVLLLMLWSNTVAYGHEEAIISWVADRLEGEMHHGPFIVFEYV